MRSASTAASRASGSLGYDEAQIASSLERSIAQNPSAEISPRLVPEALT
jgi:hypothetical protein